MASRAESSPDISEKPGQDFFSQWQTYAKIRDLNYNHHKEVYPILRNVIRSRFGKGYSMLDLGCGDAGAMSQVLKETEIVEYEGVDLSADAISLAKENLKNNPCRQELVKGDFLDVLRTLGGRFDIIWLSLSLHHLHVPHKEEVIKLSGELLREGGCLFVFDPMLIEGEDRDSFCSRWETLLRDKWTGLTTAESEAIFRHVLLADFPESYETFQSLGFKYGFKSAERLYCDEDQIYQMVCFEK